MAHRLAGPLLDALQLRLLCRIQLPLLRHLLELLALHRLDLRQHRIEHALRAGGGQQAVDVGIGRRRGQGRRDRGQAQRQGQSEAGQAAAGQRADQGHGGASCVAWTPENTCDGVIRP
ncbi:hypothetical protein D3C71_1417030 [compost metagenome]